MTNAPSVIAAQAGSVSVSAADDITIAGSHLSAGDTISLDAGDDVSITERRETTTHEEEHRQSQFGFSAGVYENVSGAVQALSNAPRAVTSGEGGAGATAVTAVSEGLRAYGAVTGALTNAAGVQASVGFSSSREELSQTSDTAYGSTLEAGLARDGAQTGNGDIAVNAGRDISVVGSQVVAANDIAFTAGRDLTIESAQNLFEEETSSRSAGVSLGASVGVGVTGVTASGSVNANFSRSQGQSESVSQVNSLVAAGGDVTLSSGRDTTIAGATISGTDIDINVGRDLTVESRQDTAEGSNSSFGVNVGVSASASSDYSTGFGDAVSGAADGFGKNAEDGPSAGAIGLNIGRGRSSSAVVATQTAITGTGAVDIDVADHTQLNGAVIAAVDSETGDDSGSLSLSTGTLEVTDFFDNAQSRQTDIGVSVSVNNPFEEEISGSNLPSLNGGHSSSDFEQTTFAALGEGEVEVCDDPDFETDSPFK